MQKNVSAAAAQRVARIWLQEPHSFSPNYQGKADALKYLASGQVEPLSLTSADFNEDGVADLAAGYGTAEGGLVVVHPGNLDAVSPQSLDSWKAIAAGNFPPAFLSSAAAFSLPDRPDFLAAGRIMGTGYSDLIAAARNSSRVNIFSGDGHGNFSSPETIAVPGTITALAAGSFGAHGPFSHVLIGVNGARHPSLVLYSGSQDGLWLQASFALPAPATAIALGDLDGDALPDAAILAGGQMFVLHSLSAKSKPVLEPLNLPVAASAFALGRFVFDRDPRLQMALLAPDGTVHIVAHSRIDSRFWTADELKTMQKSRIRPKSTAAQASLTEGWTVVESMAAVAPFTDVSRPPLLLSLRISDYGQDDVVALNGESAQMAVISHPNSKLGDLISAPAELSARPYTGGKPVAVTAMRVNADGRKGMVMLHDRQVGPSVAEPLPDPTFVVNITADTVDANPGDGKCADAQGNCSLRAAVMEANASSGIDTIVVPAGTFTLTIPDNGLGNASGGHLDITDGVNIIGASMSTTIIQAGTNVTNGIDHVFSINPIGMFHSFDTLLSNMTIQFGLASASGSDPFGGAFDWDAGTEGTGNITLSSCNLNSNSVQFLPPASGGPFGGDGGGALFSNIIGGTTGTVTITNSTVQSNIAQDAGGGIWVGSGIPLAISSSQFLNNQAVGAGAQQGGGVFVLGPNGSSQSTIQSNTTISGNQAGVQGGGIYTTEGLLIEQGTLISGNKSSGDGGGLWSNVTNETTSVIGATITSNTATGFGGGIQVDNNTVGNSLSLRFSRIVGNSAGTGTGLNNAAGTVTATDDWWGCDAPSAAPCDLVTGPVTSSPWLMLSHSANPSSVTEGASTTLTASFLQDSSGAGVSASNLGALIGLPITFGGAVNGTISNAQTAIQSTGTATATFQVTTAVSGTAQATATVDHAVVTANIAVGGFTIAISPTSQTVLAGNTTSYTVTVQSVGGFSGTVQLAINGCPANTTCSLNPTSITNASGTSTLSVATTTSTPVGPPNPTLTVTGTSGSATASGNTVLIVQNFSMSVTPATQPVDVGASGAYTVKVSRMNGFRGAVTPSVSGLPTGATATFSPATITFPATTSTMTVCTSSATVACPGTSGVTPAANSTLTVSGASGGQSRNTTATLSVVDFSISVSPPSQTINAGGTATYTVTATPINNFSAAVTPSISNLPSGATPTFTPGTAGSSTGTAQTPVNGQAVSWTLTIATTTTITAANFTMTAQETSGSLTHTTPVTLSVQDFSITPPPPLTCANAASPATGTVTLAGLNGFTGQVSLSVTSGLPAGANASFSPNPVNITGAGNFTSTLTVTTTAATPGGSPTLTITATSGALSHTATVTLCVMNFTFTVSPPSKNLNAGATANYTVTVTPVNGFTGVVALTQSGLPVTTYSFSPSSITITPTSGAQSSNLAVNTTSALGGAGFPFTVNGTDGNLVQSAGATLNIQNFTLSISPSSNTILVGATANYTLTVTPVNGYSGTLSCSVNGLPGGATFNCPPIVVPPNSGPVTGPLSIFTTASTPAENVVLTVTLTDTTGAPSQSVTPGLNTQSFVCSLSQSFEQVVAGSSVTYTVNVAPLNGFSSPVNFAVSGLPTGASATFNPNPLTGGSGSSILTVNTSTSTPLANDPLTITCSSGPITQQLSATLQVVAIQIIRPTVIQNGLGTGCFCSSYNNPANATDGNLGTAASGPPSPAVTGAFTSVNYTGFGSPVATPLAINLKASSAFSMGTAGPNSPDMILFDYSANTVSGSIYDLFGTVQGIVSRGQATDVVSLPTNTTLSSVSVGASVNNPGTATHTIYEIWIEVTHQ